MRRGLTVVVILAAIAASASSSPGTEAVQTDPKFEQLAVLVTQKMTEYGIPGVAFGMVRNGQVTVRGFGVTNLDDPQPITPDTVFPLASISKTIAATAIMRLVEQGKIDLAAPVRTYLPDFKVQDEMASREVAIRKLVFEPIGLTRAFTRLEDVATHRFSVSHRTQDGKPMVVRPMTRSTSVTAGGVSMSLNDLLTYARFHLGDGTSRDGTRVLSRASLEQMRTSRLRKNSTDEDMGLGWHLRRVGGVMTAAHGGTLGHILLFELVPERNLAFAILTNHGDGWRLIQDVERNALTVLEGMTLAPTQAIGHRGLNETIPDVPLLATQPDPAPYVGIYRRPPLTTTYDVRVEKGQLMVGNAPVAFYGPDQAVYTSGNQRWNQVEFIRRPDNTVGWVRVGGRIARKD